MPLGKVVDLGPGHIVLDGDPAPTAALPNFGPCPLWPNGHSSQQLLSSCSPISNNITERAQVICALSSACGTISTHVRITRTCSKPHRLTPVTLTVKVLSPIGVRKWSSMLHASKQSGLLFNMIIYYYHYYKCKDFSDTVVKKTLQEHCTR